jgi:hypothetical protein
MAANRRYLRIPHLQSASWLTRHAMDLNGITDTGQDCEVKMSDLKRPVNRI